MPYINKAKGTTYGSPQWLVEKYLPKKYFDVAPYPWNPDTWNGLTYQWPDKVCYCNPPFNGLSRGWSKKIKAEALKGTKIVLLMPVRSGSKYTRTDLLPLCSHIVLLPKIKFVDHEKVCEIHSVCPAALMLMYFNWKPKDLIHLKCSLSL